MNDWDGEKYTPNKRSLFNELMEGVQAMKKMREEKKTYKLGTTSDRNTPFPDPLTARTLPPLQQPYSKTKQNEDDVRIHTAGQVFTGSSLAEAQAKVQEQQALFEVNQRNGVDWATTYELLAAREATAVGDLNSDAKGSGARKNEGKERMELIPVSVWSRRWLHTDKVFENRHIHTMMDYLEEWQEGGDDALAEWLSEYCPDAWLNASVDVLEFGAQKYKAWNWAKGMQWSVCVGCILRHTKAILGGEVLDPDSKHPHAGHITANIIFLERFIDQYPEGDDRPPRFV